MKRLIGWRIMRYEQLGKGYYLTECSGNRDKFYADTKVAIPRKRWLVNTNREAAINIMGSYLRDHAEDNFAMVSFDCTGLVDDEEFHNSWLEGALPSNITVEVNLPIVISIQPMNVERREPAQPLLAFMSLLA